MRIRMMDLVLFAFVHARELKVVKNADGVWLSCADGYPLNLLTGEIERVPSDSPRHLPEAGGL